MIAHHFATRNTHLPPADESLMLDYIVGAGGIYARSRRPGLEACVPVAAAAVRGLRAVEPYAQWGFPRVPASFVVLIFEVSRAVAQNSPREALFYLSFGARCSSNHLLCEFGWHLEFPQQVGSESEVRPIAVGAGAAEESALIEVHSHHLMRAEFSAVDDKDEGTLAFRVFAVVGEIFRNPTIRARVGLFGHFLEYPAAEFFELPAGVTDCVKP